MIAPNGKYTIDKFEGETAVLLYREDERIKLDVKKGSLPKESKEGDLLDVCFNASHQIEAAVILKEETELARKKARQLLQRLQDKTNKT